MLTLINDLSFFSKKKYESQFFNKFCIINFIKYNLKITKTYCKAVYFF